MTASGRRVFIISNFFKDSDSEVFYLYEQDSTTFGRAPSGVALNMNPID